MSVHPREVCLYWMLYVVACKLQIIPGITSFLRNTKQYNLFSNSAFKIVSLCKHTLLPASVKFLETILFSSSVAFLMMSVASQKCRLFNVDFCRWKMHKISCRQGRREWDMLQCFPRCSLLRIPWPKLTGVLEHCRGGETNCRFSIFMGVSFWTNL